MASRAAAAQESHLHLPDVQGDRDTSRQEGPYRSAQGDNLLLRMQRTIGNRAVQSVLDADMRQPDHPAPAALQRAMLAAAGRPAGNRSPGRVLQSETPTTLAPPGVQRACSCGGAVATPCAACHAMRGKAFGPAPEQRHTIQQTGSSTTNVQRYSWDEFKSDASDAGQSIINAGSAVVAGAEDLGKKAVEGAKEVGSAVVSGAESVGSAVVSGAKSVGSAVVSGAKSVGSAVVSGAEALGAAAESGLDWIETEAGKLALEGANKIAGLFGGTVTVTPAGIEITIGDIELEELEDETFVLPLGIPTQTLFEKDFEVGSFVMQAWAGTIIGDPSVTLAVGPMRLQNIKVVLDPVGGNYSGTAQLYIGSAISGSVEKANELRIGAAGLLPFEPPIPIIASAEAGIRTALRLVGKEGIKQTVAVSYAGGSFNFNLDSDIQLGALADLAHEAFLRVEIEADEICSVIWPLSSHRLGEAGIEIKAPLSVSSGSGSSSVKIGAPTASPLAPDAIETDLQDEHQPTHCIGLEDLGKLLCGKGKLPPDVCSVLFPAKPGATAFGPTTPPGPVGPLAPPVTPPVPASAPTGRTPSDPIDMQWFKPDNLYDTPIILDGQKYHRTKPGQELPAPDSNLEIGVERQYLPKVGKLLILAFEPDAGGKGRFNARLKAHGYGGAKGAGTDADHNQDLQWAGPDEFFNLWPFDSSANRSAGPLQNDLQKITFSDRPGDPPRPPMSLGEFKRLGLHHDHKYFRIKCISLTPGCP